LKNFFEGGILTQVMKPLNEWYAIGFDEGDLALVCFSTSFAEYILTESSKTYVLFMLLKRKYT